MVGILLVQGVEAAEVKSLPRVLIIGDSISIGYTDSVKKMLAGKAAVQRIPENGRNTAYGLEQLKTWLGDTKWDVIHFNWGLHDIKHVRDGKLDASGELVATLEVYSKNLEELVKQLSATGAKLIWASTTPVPDGAAGRVTGDEVRYNGVAEALMKKYGVQVEDLYSRVKPNLTNYQQPRNVHFTPEGSEFLAEQVAAEILKALEPCRAGWEERFAQPPADARILQIIHTWPDQPDAQDQLIAQLRTRGFGGVVCNVAWNQYLESDDKWLAFTRAVKTAKEAGLAMWLYDERGYPSGNAGGITLRDHPEWEARGLLVADTESTGGPVTLDLPPGKLVLAGAFPVHDGNIDMAHKVDLAAQVHDGKLNWQAPAGRSADASRSPRRLR